METTVQRRAINPLRWQDEFRFDQGYEVSGYQRTLYLSGQVAIDPGGNLGAEGDMAGQIDRRIADIEVVVAEADTAVENVVGLNIYTTGVDSFLANDQALNRLFDAGCRYSSTLIGVERLAFAEFLVELEASAVA